MEDESSSSSASLNRDPADPASLYLSLCRRHLPSAEIQPTQPTDRRPICPLLDMCYTCHQLKRPWLQFSPCSFCSRSIDRGYKHQRRSFSEASALGPRASPPRLMDNSTANMDKAILSSLRARTKSWNSHTKKRPTDAEVMKLVLNDVDQAFGLNLALLKDRIKKYESMVQKHLDSGEDIVENKGMLLNVFSYLRLSKDRVKLIRPQSSSSEKRTRDGEDDSDSNPAKRASCSESVGKQFTGLELSQNDNVGSFGKCSSILHKAGLPEPILWKVLDAVKADLELRELVLTLPMKKATNYLLHRLNIPHVQE